MIPQDLPPLSTKTKYAALRSLVRTGLTLTDCVTFFASHRSEEELYYVNLAKERYHVDGELEVDDTAAVSLSDDPNPDGAYVSVWVWVSKEEADG